MRQRVEKLSRELKEAAEKRETAAIPEQRSVRGISFSCRWLNRRIAVPLPVRGFSELPLRAVRN